MRIVGTLMVRDEVDIAAAMVEHHLAQGLDQLIVTDNASEDGTREVLEAYVGTGLVELHHDPEHRKQQHAVVTAMARRARSVHRADWVLNLDADEFLVPLDRSLTVREALAQTSLHLNAFAVPVTNLVGPAAWAGSGISRLTWRDHRTDAQLRQVGIHAQPTPNAVHRGEIDVVVAQGNHFVNLTSNGQPPPEAALEVLHLPWRSWAQLERKVLNAGLGYERNPDLRPSKNHHGMADYRRYRSGRLQNAYLARTPLRSELEDGEAGGDYVRETWLAEHLVSLLDTAHERTLLAAAVDPATDVPVPDEEHVAGARLGQTWLEEERRAREEPA